MRDAHVNTVWNLCIANAVHGCYCINATAIRNPKTYEAYQEALLARGFAVTPLAPLDRDRAVVPVSAADRYAVTLECYRLAH